MNLMSTDLLADECIAGWWLAKKLAQRSVGEQMPLEYRSEVVSSVESA